MIIRIPREFTADQGSTVIIKLNILTVQYMKHSSPDTTGMIISLNQIIPCWRLVNNLGFCMVNLLSENSLGKGKISNLVNCQES